MYCVRRFFAMTCTFGSERPSAVRRVANADCE